MLFHEWLNTLNPKLRFTINFSKESIEYLDVTVRLVDNNITTAMYSKPSDTHAYLLPTSNHPTHICKNIPNSVMKRVRGIAQKRKLETLLIKSTKGFSKAGVTLSH